jgi:hypothetical protein
MLLNEESLYISGLTNMASSVSKRMGPSYVQADCFDDKNYIKDFCECYEVDESNVELVQQNTSFEDLMTDLFGDDVDKLIEGLTHWIHMRAGEPRRILSVENRKLLDVLSEGYGPFYYVEDIYFIEFEKMVICFMIGNDE